MLDMSWHITIGSYELRMMEKVEITHSVEMLSDTAKIILPATAYNATIDVEAKIKRGDAVTIKLGYDGKLITEFEGFLESITTDGGSLILNCEDGLFQYRKKLPNKELVNASVKDILAYVHETIKGFNVSCDYDFSYEKFVISNATGYDVLKKIQEEAKPNIYVKGAVLHIHPQYIEIFGSAVYDFAKNIDADGCDLKYRLETERKFMVTVESKGSDGKTIKVEEGTTGGDSITLKISGVTNEASMRKLAKQALLQKTYTGYEGTFTAWLIPYCDAGYDVMIVDADYPEKNGHYYVIEVKVEFSSAGGKRIIKLGKKLSNG